MAKIARPDYAGKSAVLITGLSSIALAAAADSLWFSANDTPAPSYDYAQQRTLPAGFGSGEFSLELWLKPDARYPLGPTASGQAQRLNWTSTDTAPYSTYEWWFRGNFLLDGHNNNDFAQGTFSLQFYGGGRVRWLFGDGANPGSGGVWSIGAYPASAAPSLLDNRWHYLVLVRRWHSSGGARLELWLDAQLLASATTPRRTDLRPWWNSWSGFPAGQEGWFWGVEKQAAIGLLSQYEDYKGALDELRFWNRALSAADIQAHYRQPLLGNEPGLVGHFPFSEGRGALTVDALNPTRSLALVNPNNSLWSAADGQPGPEPDPGPNTVFSADFEDTP
jgi:hypothetical protein